MENYSKKSLQVQKDFVSKTQSLVKNENLTEKLNSALMAFSEKPEYGTFSDLKKTIAELDSFIKDCVKESLKANELKSSVGPAGTFTLASRSTIGYDEKAEKKDKRVEKILKYKAELKKLEDDVKQDIDLLGIDVPGAYLTTTEYAMFKAAPKDKKDKDLVVDNVEYEVIEESK